MNSKFFIIFTIFIIYNLQNSLISAYFEIDGCNFQNKTECYKSNKYCIWHNTNKYCFNKKFKVICENIDNDNECQNKNNKDFCYWKNEKCYNKEYNI